MQKFFAICSVILLVISLMQMNEKGYLFNKFYYQANILVNKRPYYRQSGIIFMLLGMISLSIAFNIELKSIGLFLFMILLIIFTIVYGIISTRKIKDGIPFYLNYKTSKVSDIEKIYCFNKELIDQYENIQSIYYEKVLEWIHEKIKTNIHEYTSIYIDDTLVGYYRLYEKGEKMELDDFYIFEEYRNQGIGSIVLEKCIQETDKPIQLYVFIKNEKAIQLYEKYGFKVTETIKNSRYIMER